MADVDLLSRYRIDQVFRGEGAVRSYLATAPDGTRVCLKVVEAAEAEARAAVERLGALAGLDHPNVARLLDRGLVAGGYALVREWVEGDHLGTRPLPVAATTDTIAGYVADAAYGLAAIHGRGLVHGDIRPSNLVLGLDGVVKLTDAEVPPAAGRQAVFAAPASDVYYRSPEELDGAPPTPQTDIYSLGAVLFELETGRPPFDAGDARATAEAHRTQMPVPPSSLNPDVPYLIDGVTLRALEKIPASRYASAGQMAAALRSTVRSEAVVGTAPPPAKSRRWIWVLVAAIVALLAILIAVLVGGGSDGVTVPDVVGLPQAEAAQALGDAGLKVGEVTQDEQAEAEPGEVVSQDPIADTEVDEGSTVDLVIAATAPVAVVEVVGLDQAAAEKAIQEAGLVVGAVTMKPTTDAEAGIVLEQSPAAGTEVEAGSTVDLVVASTEEVEVPNVVGQIQADAEKALADAGLELGTVTPRESDKVAPGVVSRQSPDAGSKVEVGSVVDLEVGAAPQVRVPDVTRVPLSEAVATLLGLGLIVGGVDYQFDPGVNTGYVLSQDPGQGTELPAGSRVGLVVSKGAEAGVVPDVVGLTESDATAALEADGFTVVVVRVESSVEPGLVTAQDPAADASLAAGGTVTIEVSQGQGAGTTTVPDLAGLDMADALEALDEAQLKAVYEFVEDDRFLQVVGQDPAAGTEVDAGSTVLLSVGMTAP